MWFCWLAVLASVASVSQGRSVNVGPTPTAPRAVWTPSDGRTLDEWLGDCHGQPADTCERVRAKLGVLDSKAAELLHRKFPHTKSLLKSVMQVDEEQPSSTAKPRPSDPQTDKLETCKLWLSEEQIDAFLAQFNNDTSPDNNNNNSRQKRQTINFDTFPSSLWSMPVVYKFDGTQTASQMSIIRNAFQHWTDNTCVRFREISTSTGYSDNHLLLTSSIAGCSSYVGKQARIIPQPINLQDICLNRFGTPVHEIGHALGLWHQQMRSDRDSAIEVVWDNIAIAYFGQFYKINSANVVPYNFGSVMHYGPQDDSSENGHSTMLALNSLYQGNMGQRTGLSFEDIKSINVAYCSGTCASTPLAQPCQHGGYQDPNNCSRCKCPDGFSGQYCDQIAPAVNGNCGGVINLESNAQTTIKSPGYDGQRHYISYQSCNWQIKVPENHVAELKFVGDFGIYCRFASCHHWVEVKYKNDLGLEGPRFCCSDRPNVTVTSESNEMLIVFRSNFSNDVFWTQRGFQAVVRAVSLNGPPALPVTAPSSSLPTSTTTTSTSTTTPTTTTSSTTTTTTSTSTTTTTTTPTLNPTPSTTSTTTTTTTTPSSTTGSSLKPTAKIDVPTSPLLPSSSTTSTTTASSPSTTTTTTTTRRSTIGDSFPSLASCDDLAMTFLLDSSSSVSVSDLSTAVNFVSTLTTHFTHNLPRTRVAVVTFASKARLVSPLADSLSDSVSSVTPSITDNRNVSGAFRIAESMIYDAIPSTADRVVILITTAGATVDTELTLPQAASARNAGLRLVVLGIGPRVNGTEAAGIAGSDSMVVYADSFSSLLDKNAVVADQLASKICQQQTTVSSVGPKIWSCSFEPSTDQLCGMIQDQTDQLDWTIFSGPTPSNPTGPDAAYDGTYYIYLEASDPSEMNDEARLIFPPLNTTGTVCIDFRYHMYGFHINTLRVIQRAVLSPTQSVSSTVWMRSHDMGNTWYHGNIEVNLSSNSQLLFVASRGEAYSGDIGLDAVNVFAGACLSS